MSYFSHYSSPLGSMLLAADDAGLTGLWFEGQKYFAHQCDLQQAQEISCEDHPAFQAAKSWLDAYFKGEEPAVSVPLHFIGTPFQKEVWEILCTIPYGETTTYGDIARELAAKKGVVRMSAQAVGGAVGHNKISIIVPCHRVVGANGKLTGYAGGIERKEFLLALESQNKRERITS